MEVVLSQPRGFCAGVIRAIEIVERALAIYGSPVYVLHEIVHNRHVVDQLRDKGAIFVEDLEQVPPEAVTVFSARRVDKAVVERGKARRLRTIDATCPLVTKVHLQAEHYHREGREVVIIGHKGHVEVEGTRGQLEDRVHVLSTVEEVEALQVRDPAHMAYVTQTTLSLDDTRTVLEALKRRFPEIRGPGLADICYATQNRQNAVRSLAGDVDLLLVVGAHNSSNSTRLREVGEQAGIESYLIQSAEDLDPRWVPGKRRVAVTAGASAPESLVRDVVDRLRSLGAEVVREMPGERETTTFPLPAE